MDHDPDTQTQIVLTRTLYKEGRPDCLKRSWRQYDPRLLIAAIDDVPVYLNNSHIQSVVQLDVESATKSHRETRFIRMKVTDAEDRRQVRAIDVKFLNGDSEEGMPKRLECWSIFRIIFYLNAAEKVLQRRIDRPTSERTREIVLTQMERIVKLGPEVFVKVVAGRQIESTQSLLFTQHIVDCRTPGIACEIVNKESRIAPKKFKLLIIILR